MATFRYIGTMTKADGTIDVRCQDSSLSMREWTGVIPNQTVIDVGTDERLVKSFENAVDLFGNYVYQRIS